MSVVSVDALARAIFLIGRDCRGNWVVQDQNGVRGGLFVSRDAALQYIRSENGDRPQAVVMVAGVFELTITHKPGALLNGHFGEFANAA